MIYEMGNYYHLYNRGCNKEPLFNCEADYKELYQRLQKSDHKSHVNILAYCLMPNHYHFLVQQKSDVPVFKWIQFIFNGYVQYYNQKYERKGTLFESRVKPKVITCDNYLMRVILYIHLNPVLANLVAAPEDWEFSNYKDWIGETKTELTDCSLINQYFRSGSEYKTMIMEAKEEKLLQRDIEGCDIEY